MSRNRDRSGVRVTWKDRVNSKGLSEEAVPKRCPKVLTGWLFFYGDSKFQEEEKYKQKTRRQETAGCVCVHVRGVCPYVAYICAYVPASLHVHVCIFGAVLICVHTCKHVHL